MIATWKSIENQKNTEAYKLHRIKKQNPSFAYEEDILQIAEQNPFLAARIAGFIDTFNQEIKSKILDVAIRIVKNTKKGEQFVWAAHTFEFYKKINILADVLDLQDEQHEMFDSMQEQGDSKPLEYFYGILIDIAEDWETSSFLYQIFLSRTAYITGVIYSTLINKSPNFEIAFEIFEEMKSKNLVPNEITYSTLINKANTFEQAKSFFEEMKSKNLVPNEISYSTLINKANTFEQAKFFFEEMKSENLKPNEISYSTLINKATSFEQQKNIYHEFISKFPLRKGNFKSEKNYNYLFTALFKKIKNKNDWDFVKTEIYRLGLKMNDYTQSFYDNLSRKYQ